MSDMKCVKCNSDLERIGDFYTCTNPHCTLCGDKDMWQELIRTRKALDIAVESLNDIANLDDGSTVYNSEQFLRTRAYVKSALEQITEINDDKAV